MFEFLNFTADRVQIFLLVIVRASGMLAFAPIIGHKSIPVMAKIGFMILLSIIIVSTFDTISIVPIESNWDLGGAVLKELFVGTTISLLFVLIFHAAQTAGSLIGYQVGLAMASEFDPNVGAQVSVIGRFWFIMASLIFLTIDGHHMMISAFANSYEVIPAGAVYLDSSIAELVMKYTAYVFVLALKISAPVLITLFLTDVALGTIAKTMPTMNVFFVGFPVKIAMGLIVMAMSLPAFAYVLRQGIIYLDGELNQMFHLMGKA